MPQRAPKTFMLAIPGHGEVTIKLDEPERMAPDTPTLILAHGANNDLDFPLLSHLATHLSRANLAQTIRFNFPYVERGATSPDPRAVLETTFIHVYAHAVDSLRAPGAPVFVAGKSLGGRAAAELVSRRSEGEGLDAAGLLVLGYPLHAAGKQERLFLEPLRHIDIPSLFCIGTRDSLCDPRLLRPVLAELDHPGTLFVVEGGDHSLHLPRSSGRSPDDTYPDIAREVARFVERTA